MSNTFSVDLDAEKLLKAMRKAPREIAKAMRGAGKESSDAILDTRGLREYPPATSANRPPTPYYIRGRGTQYKSGNDHSSERYGQKWTTKTYADRTVVGNRASYAEYVGGEKSPHHMRTKGWRRLVGVVKELMARGRIKRIYEKWLNRAFRKIGLQ